MSGLFRDEDHRYFVSARVDDDHWIGDPVPYGPLVSVTTVLDALDKPAIPRWAAKKVAEFAVHEYTAIGTMIGGMGTQGTIDALKGVPWNTRDRAADLGSRVHAIAEAISRGQAVPQEEADNPKVKQYQRFVAELRPEFVGIEQMIVNFTEGYGGTGDFWAKMIVPHPDGPKASDPYTGGTMPQAPELWLVDNKTSDLDKNGPYRDMWLQLAGLNGGEWWGWPDQELLQLAPKAERFGILQLADDHYTLWEGRITEAEYQAFLHVKGTHDWFQGPLKTVKVGKVKREVAA